MDSFGRSLAQKFPPRSLRHGIAITRAVWSSITQPLLPSHHAVRCVQPKSTRGEQHTHSRAQPLGSPDTSPDRKYQLTCRLRTTSHARGSVWSAKAPRAVPFFLGRAATAASTSAASAWAYTARTSGDGHRRPSKGSTWSLLCKETTKAN